MARGEGRCIFHQPLAESCGTQRGAPQLTNDRFQSNELHHPRLHMLHVLRGQTTLQIPQPLQRSRDSSTLVPLHVAGPVVEALANLHFQPLAGEDLLKGNSRDGGAAGRQGRVLDRAVLVEEMKRLLPFARFARGMVAPNAGV